MSIYDRNYMGGSDGFGSPGKGGSPLKRFFATDTALKALIAINIIVFFIGAVVDRILGAGVFNSWFELSLPDLLKGKVWTIVTYSFMHASLAHIALNMLVIYFMGLPALRWLGTRKFLVLYFAGAVVGGLVWLLSDVANYYIFSEPISAVVGASAAAAALFAFFCAFYPDRPMTFLLFFVFPITMRPITMLKVVAGLEVLGLLYGITVGGPNIAYTAHLGGLAVGYLYARAEARGRLDFINSFSLGKISSDKGRKSADQYRFKVNITNPDELKGEVDRILDKINRKGFSALTDDERETLRRAKEYLK